MTTMVGKIETHSAEGIAQALGSWMQDIRRVMKNRSVTLGVIILAFVFILAFVVPVFYDKDPIKQSLTDRLMPPVWQEKGTWQHPLGTDQLGRDMLSRVIMGTRISLFIGVGAMLLSSTLGVTLGMISGYFGGPLDAIIQRYVEIQMAFPFIVIAIIVMAFIKATPVTIVIVFMFTGWIIYGRIIRGVTLAVRQSEYVQAAHVIGASSWRIIPRHVFPNILSTVLVLATLELPVLILGEAVLSFLGVGLRPPTRSLGSMLGDGRVYLTNAWWLSTLPGLMLMFLTMGVNFLGDGLREVLDPTLSDLRR